MATAGTAYVDLRARLDQFEKDLQRVGPAVSRAGTGMERGWRSSLGRVSSGLKSFGNRATIGLTAPLLLAGRAANDAAKEAALGQAQLIAVLESTGGAANVTADEVNALAESLAATTLHEDDAVIAGANMLLTFKNIRNEIGANNDIFNQTTSILADFSSAMGTDMSSSAIQLGKALNDPVKGVTALGRAGVQFSEEQRAQIERMVEHNDLLGAQKIVLAELADQFGGVAEAQAKTDAGQQIQATKEAGEALEELGKSLAPILADISRSLVPLLRRFSELPSGVQTALFVMAAGVGPVARLTGSLLGLSRAVRGVNDATTVAAGSKGIAGMSAATKGLVGSLGAVAAVAVTTKVAFDQWLKVQDETIKTNEIHAQSIQDSHFLMTTLAKSVENGTMSLEQFERQASGLIAVEGQTAQETAELAQRFGTLRNSILETTREINGQRYSVQGLIRDLKNVPREVTTYIKTVRQVEGADPNFNKPLQGFADGGSVRPRQTFLVGERGPEILQMGSRGGTVVPNHKLGGVTVQVFVKNNYGADDLATTVERALRNKNIRVGA